MYNEIIKMKEGDFIMQLLKVISESTGLKVLLILIILDTIFGTLRALKERKVNSNIGIDGLIRKFGMVISVLFFIPIDLITNFNLIGFIPEAIRNILPLQEVGISTLFFLIYWVYEGLSILKNMVKCKLPIPKKLQIFLEKMLNEFTTELKEGEEK